MCPCKKNFRGGGCKWKIIRGGGGWVRSGKNLEGGGVRSEIFPGGSNLKCYPLPGAVVADALNPTIASKSPFPSYSNHLLK